MAKVEDCPGFETFGADVKAARKARRLARKALAEMVGIEWRYLANIENKGTIPSLPVVIQLIKTCGLPVERYFNPEVLRSESEQLRASCGTVFQSRSAALGKRTAAACRSQAETLSRRIPADHRGRD